MKRIAAMETALALFTATAASRHHTPELFFIGDELQGEAPKPAAHPSHVPAVHGGDECGPHKDIDATAAENSAEESMKTATENSDKKKNIELTDGNTNTVGNEQIRCPDVLNQPTLIEEKANSVEDTTSQSDMKCDDDISKDMHDKIAEEAKSVEDTTFQSDMKCDDDISKDLYAMEEQITEFQKHLDSSPHDQDVLAQLAEARRSYLKLWLTSIEKTKSNLTEMKTLDKAPGKKQKKKKTSSSRR